MTTYKAPYRPEIDGLRAIAVCAVIIHHFDKSLLPGGYLGVDIFFVISGYVITSSLLARDHKTFKAFILEFYARRFKRLIPSLVFCIAITALLGCLIIPDPTSSLFTGIFALVGASNFYLLHQANDYFGPLIQWDLFAQTWSLGVEEQFYLAFPFILWIFRNSNFRYFKETNLLLVMSLFSIISLSYNWFLIGVNEVEAFYMITTRFWELGVGCITFISINRSNIFSNYTRRYGPLLTIVILFICFFVPREFNLVSTSSVVVLSALLLATLTPESPVNKVLSCRPFVLIGLLSYSLYLWHWSVIVLSRLTIGIHWWSVPIQLALIFTLSALTYRFIEKPFRYTILSVNNSRSIIFGLSTSVLCAGLLFILSDHLHDYLYAGKRIEPIKARFLNCHYDTTVVPKADFKKCSRSKTSNPDQRFIFRGNSHAGHLSGVLRHLYQNNMSVQLMYSGQHPFPHIGFPEKKDLSKMGRFGGIKLIQERILNITLDSIIPNDIVVISNLAFAPPNHDLTSFNFSLTPYFDHERWLHGVASLADELKKKKVNIILIAPLPIFRTDPQTETLPSYICSEEWFRPALPSSCHRKSDKLLLKKAFNSYLTRLSDLEQRKSNVYVFNPFPALCPNPNDCTNYFGSIKTFVDHNHLTEEGGEYFAKSFWDFLKKSKLISQN
ncbi:MAG: acyltransferase family protein [Nitrospinales bacterium]